jgi:hypothetical protein
VRGREKEEEEEGGGGEAKVERMIGGGRSAVNEV